MATRVDEDEEVSSEEEEEEDAAAAALLEQLYHEEEEDDDEEDGGWWEGGGGGGNETDGSGSDSIGDEYVDAPLLRLELVGGPMRGVILDIDGKSHQNSNHHQDSESGVITCTIGSSAGCTLCLHGDLTVDPLHAVITHVNGSGWSLTDLNSRDGTHLLLPDRGVALTIGDQIRIGRTDLTFYVRVATESTCRMEALEAISCECGDRQVGKDDVWTIAPASYLSEHANQLSALSRGARRRRARALMRLLCATMCLLVIAGILTPLLLYITYNPCAALAAKLTRNATQLAESYAYDDTPEANQQFLAGMFGTRRQLQGFYSEPPVEEEDEEVKDDPTVGMSAVNCTIALEYIEMLDAAKRDRNQQKRMEKAMSSMGAASPPPPASWW